MKTTSSPKSHFFEKNALILAAAILLIALAAYLYIWRDAPYLLKDSVGYMQVAQNMALGNLSEIQDRVPIFPLLLLLTNSFEQPNIILYIIQLVSYFIFVFIVYKILVDELPVGFAYVYLLISILPPLVEATAQVMTEALTTNLILLIFICLYELVKTRKFIYALGSGVFSGALALTRPTFELMPILLLLIFVCISLLAKEKKKWVLHSIVSILSCSVIIGGYALYNYLAYDYFVLTPLQGFNLSTRTETYIERIPDDQKTIRDVLLKTRNELMLSEPTHSAVMYIWTAIPRLEEATSLSEIELSKLFQSINFKLIVGSPLSYIVEVGHSMAIYTMPSASEQANFYNNWFQLLWLMLNYVVLAATFVCVCGAMGILILSSQKSTTAMLQNKLPLFSIYLFCTVIVFYNFCISTFLEVGNPRYRLPTDLLIIIFDLISVYAFIRFRNNNRIEEPAN